MKRLFLSGLLVAMIASPAALAASTDKPDPARMQWFADAKLGIFIHWGIYSVDGVDESWSFHNGKISHADYMEQMDRFTADLYDPAAWADLISRSGARYAVITTKHHDGVALWDTELVPGAEPGRPDPPEPLSVAARSPAGRDVIAPFFAELRKRGLKAGAYFSLSDWSDPDYPGFTRDSTRYRIAEDPQRWQEFLGYCQGQIREIADRLDPDLWWFDGDWEHDAEEWQAERVRSLILEANPRAIINGRLAGHGDYETPEQNIPVETPATPWWELCLTIGDEWGWQPQDIACKSSRDLIAIFADVIGHGGNLLLDVGPREDGTIPAGQVEVLEEIGRWNAKHAEAVFGTRAGLPGGHFHGPSTLSPDSTALYLFVPQGAGCSVWIKGLENAVTSVRVVGMDLELPHRVVGKISWSRIPGLVFIDVPLMAADPMLTVLAVELEGPLRLYRGAGGLY
ncbi:MAG: alpha-L-fucosidase [Candidatus Krumholzibacteriia bacterium]